MWRTADDTIDLSPLRLSGLLSLLLLALPAIALAQPGPVCRTAQVVLITIDGLRWQEVFRGIDPEIYRDSSSIRHRKTFADFEAAYWRSTPAERRAALMPFVWTEIAAHGQLHGDPMRGANVRVSNPYRFSYPGYNEILTGVADPRIASNDKVANPNRTVLEWLHTMPAFAGRVAAFGSWDVFPYIINAARSGIPVNAGFEPLTLPGDPEVAWLNRLQAEIPSPWDTVRLDAFTYRFAKAYLAAERPRVLYLALGETDDFAHDGFYDLYATAAERADSFIADLWQWLQQDPQYRDRTTLIITTDHGRGRTLADWRFHGAGINPDRPSGFPGDDESWLAIIGPDTPALGVVAGVESTAAQVPATLAAALGLIYQDDHPDLSAPEPIRNAIVCDP